MSKILIIKTEASGDVVRTSVLINAIDADIFWITSQYNLPIFPDGHPKLKKVAAIENIPPELFNIDFDLIINLEESIHIAGLLNNFRAKKMIGVYLKNGKLEYTSEGSEWFDMSLISRLGKQKADMLKKENKFTYQHYLFQMIGREFSNEKYCIYKSPYATPLSGKIAGIEQHVGERWPNKTWSGYKELQDQLTKKGITVFPFERREHLREYLDDIARCTFLVTGDTLAMHVALAYEIPCVAIFNCTSPDEIYDYNILKKAVSPLLEQVYYQTTHLPEATEAIRVSEVMEHLSSLKQINL